MLVSIMARQMTSAEFARLKNVSIDKVLRAARRVEGTKQAFGKRIPGAGHGSWVFTLADSERFDNLQGKGKAKMGDLHVRVEQELLDRVDGLTENRSEAVREALTLWLRKAKAKK